RRQPNSGKVTTNARAVARVAGITGIPFAAGASRPLVGPQLIPDEIHGDSGLDGPQLPEPSVPLEDIHAVNLIAQVISANEPGSVVLLPTGSLTNIAPLARTYRPPAQLVC